MANTLYDKSRERFATAQIHWINDSLKMSLVTTVGGYAVNAATHEYWADVGFSSRIGTSVTLSSKAVVGGAVDCADVTFTSVAAGHTIGAIIVYKDVGGEDSDSPLIAYLDTATGLPLPTNGGDVIATIDNGPNRLFRL